MGGEDQARRPGHDNLRGGLWLIASAICFTVAMSLVKHLGSHLTAASQTFFTHAISIAVLLPVTLINWRTMLRPAQPGLLMLRSLLSTVGVALGFYSFQALTLADANALSFTRALWMFPLAALILGERLRVEVIVACLVAFGGVLLVGSGSGGEHQFGWGMVAGLLASITTALVAVVIRGLRDNETLVLLAWGSLLGILFSAPLAVLAGWQTPSWTDLGLLVLLTVFTLAQQGCYIKGLQTGEASAVIPFDYTRIVFVVASGMIFFGEVPPLTTIGGVLVISGAALYILWRSSRRAACGDG